MPTAEMLRLSPADEIGPVLAGRSAAQKMRLRIEAATVREAVSVDFSGVAFASPSFVDELVAKLPPHLLREGRVRWENVPAELQPLFRFVVRQRSENAQAS